MSTHLSPRALLPSSILAFLMGCGGDIGIVKHDVDDDNDGYNVGVDCDDANSEINPTADERCDGVDNDCDGLIDEGAIDAAVWHNDGDGDGFGDPASATTACEPTPGQISDGTDCDDTQDSVYPGGAEICDGLDNDCDDAVDEDAEDLSTFYLDDDEDGYGDPGLSLVACTAAPGYVEDDTDCDDADPAIHPGAPEEDCTDPVDYNCDGSVGYDDGDGDGVPACEDCDDGDAARAPGLSEVCDASDTDEDCSGAADDEDPGVDASTYTPWYRDADRDGYGDASLSVAQCDAPEGYVADEDDCDDGDDGINPGEAEICDPADTDEDCDGLADDDDPSATGGSTWYRDADSDGYGLSSSTTSACDLPSGYVAGSGDCDDGDGDVNPGEAEICDPADTDEDCDGLADDDDPSVTGGSTFYADSDGDGYGDPGSASSRCEASASWVDDDQDCDDGDEDSYPGAPELCDDGVDQDCSGADLACTITYVPSGEIISDSVTTRVEGEASTTFVGIAPVTHADLNGDGYDDYLVPARGTTAGEVFVYYGPLEGAYTTTSTEADAVIVGAAVSDYAYQAAPIGDQDGDGTEDFAIGASKYDYSGLTDAGAVFVLPGSTTGSVTLSTSLPVFYGATASDSLGRSVCAAGDTNEDGYGDMLVSADGYSSGRGAVYLMEGPFTSGARSVATYASTTWVGESSSSYAGFQVIGDVDLNDDGEEDVVIGAFGYSSSKGRVYVYYGPFSSGTITLGTATADAVLTGGATGDYFGARMSVIPDMDGDGFDELAIGAYLLDDGATDAGAAYVFYGPLSGSYAPGDADIVVHGAGTRDYLGYAIAGLEDIDGDGRGELVVSSLGYGSDYGDESGAVLVFFGGHEGDIDLLDADIVYVGTGVGDSLGTYVTAGGDFDADGVPDLIMNAYVDEYEDPSLVQTGLVYFAPGNRDNRLVNGADATVGGVTGEGLSVSRAGDFDHDGYDDLLTASTDGSGSVMLYLGPLSGATSSYDAIFSGDASGDRLGNGLDGGGRINSDAYDDLVIGAPYADSGATNGGEVYVITGRSTPTSYTAGTSAFANYYGASASDYLGYSVSLVEDWDGDGYDDVVMGAPGYASLTGRVYLVTAPASTHKGSVTTYADCTFTSSSSAAEFGVSVDGDGDIDGDGYGDVLIGAPGWDAPSRNAGAAFVFYGGSTGTFTTSSADATLLGTTYDGAAGSAVSIVGDANGDGYDDVVVGAPWENPAGASSGAAYLVLGPLSGSSSLSLADAVLEGVEAGEYVGESVDGVGDVNGDGYDDWMTGGVGSDRGFTNGGTAHLVYGPGGVASAYTFHGPYDGAYAGEVGGAGDLNGDGRDDLVIGGYGEDSAWIFFGR